MKKQNCEKEEWGGWKIVSDMLDHPDNIGIYPTGKCYQKLYEFVVAQKKKARKKMIKDIGMLRFFIYPHQVKRSKEWMSGYNYCKKGTLETLKEIKL
jgi:hypothetical protein